MEKKHTHTQKYPSQSVLLSSSLGSGSVLLLAACLLRSALRL